MELKREDVVLLKGKLKDIFSANSLGDFEIEIEDFSILFTKDEKYRACNLYWSFFIDKFRKNEVNFSNVTYGSGIIFKGVNSILSEVVEIGVENTVVKFPDMNNNFDIHFISNVPIMANGYFQEDNFNSLMKLVVANIKTYHFPFFERVSSLQVVNDEIINKVPQMELGNFIPGQYMNPKKLIIMKLCNNPKYGEFKNWLVEVFEKVIKTEPDRYLEGFKVVMATIEYLDSGKYKELL